MQEGRVAAFRRAIAWTLVLCTMLVPLTLVSGIHEHNEHSSHCCDFCHFGHVPWVQPAASAQIEPPVIHEWRHSTDECGALFELDTITTSTRAPPAA